MNSLLLRILDRYEVDKPILMADKLDIIWDKNTKARPENDIDNEQEDILLTKEEIKKKKQARIKAQAELKREEERHSQNNVNHYAVKQKLG